MNETMTAIPTDRNAVIARIRAALKARSGKTWSVTGGTGTGWGWIHVDAPPARRTWHWVRQDGVDGDGQTIYRNLDTGRPGGHMAPTEQDALAALLNKAVHIQGERIPAGRDYYREYIDRAEGRAPSVTGSPYWD